MIFKIFKHKGRELVVQVDDQDAHLLEGTWHIANCGISRGMDKFYVRRTGPRPALKSIYLHREIACPLPGQVVDHRDANGLNCCRANLLVTT